MRGRPEITAHLVDFVQHEDGVVGAGAPKPLDDAAGQGAHVGAPMAPDFGLVAHAAQGDPVKFAAQGPGNGVAQRCLAGSRRAGKAEDRALGVGFQFSYGQVFDDAAFGFSRPK
jgi:hypothetical protein